MEHSILIIDDDIELCGLLAEFLQLEGFSIYTVHDGAQAVEHLRGHRYDALVLDIMLPGMQGLDVLRRVREFCAAPVLMLTARGEDTDRIVGLEMGADDYLPKPCNPRELAARLRAILRRTGQPDGPGAALAVGATLLDPAVRSATHAGQDLALTSAEFNVLRLLLARAGSVVYKDSVRQEALGRPLTAYDRSIVVLVSKIRMYLAACGGTELIVCVRGVG